MDYLDDIIFAVGPLGIIWVLSAAIRAIGPKFLKERIGKGSENEALIERDLTSSTSADVCELWDGETVKRIKGEAYIQEFLLLGDTLWKSDDGKEQFFHPYGAS